MCAVTVVQHYAEKVLVRAEKNIHEHEVIRLNAQDAETFFKKLNKPVRFNKKLIAAFVEYEQRVACTLDERSVIRALPC